MISFEINFLKFGRVIGRVFYESFIVKIVTIENAIVATLRWPL